MIFFYYISATDVAKGEIHNDSSNALLCPPNVTEQSMGLVEPDPVGFHHWWQQDLTVPLYLIVPFLFLLNLRDARIFTYFNSLGMYQKTDEYILDLGVL